MLYPAAEAVLLDWWHQKRQQVQTAVQAAAATLGMVALPALLSACLRCDCPSSGDAVDAGSGDSNGAQHCEGCWRGAYSALGALLALPVAALSAFFIEGGAADHDLFIDDEPSGDAGLLAAARTEEARQQAELELADVRMEKAAAQASGVLPAVAEESTLAAGQAPDAACGDGHSALGAPPMLAPSTPPRIPRMRRSRTPMWALHDVLTHTTFWLAQLSIATVQALVAAFLFHRAHLAATHFSPDASAMPLAEAALFSPQALPVELLVGALTVVCCKGSAWFELGSQQTTPQIFLCSALPTSLGRRLSCTAPLNLLVRRKEYLVLIVSLEGSTNPSGCAWMLCSSRTHQAHFSVTCSFRATAKGDWPRRHRRAPAC